MIQEGRGRPGCSAGTGQDLHCTYHISTKGEAELTAGWRGGGGERTEGKQLEDLAKHFKVCEW